MDDQNPDKGKCVTCGLLCVVTKPRLGDASQRFIEASAGARAAGGLFSVRPEAGATRTITCQPHCIADEANLWEETCQSAGAMSLSATDNVEPIIAVIHRDRACDRWVQYQPGMSPQEHREQAMIRHEQLAQFHEIKGIARWQLGIGIATLVAAIFVPVLLQRCSPITLVIPPTNQTSPDASPSPSAEPAPPHAASPVSGST